MSISNSLLWRGLLAIVIGIVSVAWPNVTVGALVILFAVYAFIAAGWDAVAAFSSDRAGPVLGWLLLSLLSIAAGIVALVWPGITAIVLTVCVGVWAVVTGVVEMVVTFQGSKTAGERALWMLTGLVSVAFGVVLFIRPDIGALSLATVFGLYAIVYGVSGVVLSIHTRKAGAAAPQTATAAA
ncbi:uncharacterized membrane protein HdeD (DUF308 family) [Kribbella steppae]|uniref:Uncharacterized membrane protein HdeD (DUF308 family) n=1 Tax=Kribbella steppae TaxID=2512223 RepID=A0A4R2H6G9_9ACTN|nr:DUF308 domain-containing protein [Kribbella steppae]TCO19732.1 uncharacterized membrane protein HdeD (DUF308 family) [Kribbella steppae]